MSELIFLTDRYPYNNSEAFIENEIEITAKNFEKVYILPCGLMVNTNTYREVPNNVKVLKPPLEDDICKNKPSKLKKILWGIKNLLGWYILCFFIPDFYKECIYMKKNVGLTLQRCTRVLRTLAPALRNMYYYKKKLAKEDFTNVYVYSYWVEPTILFANKIIPNVKIRKQICRTHRWDLYSEESPVGYLPFQKKILEVIDKLYVISMDGKGYLSKKYPELSNKIEVSRLGTKNYGLNPAKTKDSFVIVSCSNIIPVKRVNLIIDALALLQTNQRIEWIHFGTGQYAKEIEKYAQIKLDGKIRYKFKGQVSNFEIIEFYKTNHVDVFVNVSSSEGIPVSIMEATSFGIPIIATDVGGTGEIVFECKNGFLLPKNFKIEVLSQIITEMIRNNIHNEQLRIQSRICWQQDYYYKTNYDTFYKDFLGE